MKPLALSLPYEIGEPKWNSGTYPCGWICEAYSDKASACRYKGDDSESAYQLDNTGNHMDKAFV